MRKYNEELPQLTPAQSREKVDQLRAVLFSTQLNASTSHVKDYSQFKKLRKDIARALTVISQKEAVQ